MLRFLLLIFIPVFLHAERVEIPLETKGTKACVISLALDEHGLFTLSDLLDLEDLSRDNLISKLKKLKRKINRIRKRIIKLDNKNKDKRANRLRSKVNGFKSYRQELKNCLRQSGRFFVDQGIGFNPAVCEVVTVPGRFSRIINGKECTDTGSSVVSLSLKARNGESFLCSGTVIDSRHILTAAHCAEGIDRITVAFGLAEFVSTTLFVHPDYDGSERNDIALVRFNSDLPVASQAIIERFQRLSGGEKVFFAGYGLDNFSNTDRLLIGSNTIDSFSAKSIFIRFSSNSESNSCSGDSGGPLYIYRNSRWEVAGVVSNGVRRDCGIGDFSGFANLKSRSNQNFIKDYAPAAIN